MYQSQPDVAIGFILNNPGASVSVSGTADTSEINLIDTGQDSATLEKGKPGIHQVYPPPAFQTLRSKYREYINATVGEGAECPALIICTMRTKTVWEVVEGPIGKKIPQKIGLKPEQREGMEYEFSLVLDLSIDSHMVTAGKDRTSLFDGRHFMQAISTGKELRYLLEPGRIRKRSARSCWQL